MRNLHTPLGDSNRDVTSTPNLLYNPSGRPPVPCVLYLRTIMIAQWLELAISGGTESKEGPDDGVATLLFPLSISFLHFFISTLLHFCISTYSLS